jgi:hypothetical protein
VHTYRCTDRPLNIYINFGLLYPRVSLASMSPDPTVQLARKLKQATLPFHTHTHTPLTRLGLRFDEGLWYVKSQFPVHGLLYLACSIYPCFAYPTVLGGVFMMITGAVYCLATHYKARASGCVWLFEYLHDVNACRRLRQGSQAHTRL